MLMTRVGEIGGERESSCAEEAAVEGSSDKRDSE